MGAVQFGVGISGILVNVIRIIIIYIGLHSKKVDEDPFMNNFVFYLVTTACLIVSASMYFIERSSPYAKHYNSL